MSHGHCEDCFKAVRHEGTPVGRIEKINGVDTYVTLPKGEYLKNTAIIFITDVFGIQALNNQLLADDFARNGFATYIPDYLNGDPITDEMHAKAKTSPEEWMKVEMEWLSRHPDEVARPPLDTFIGGLRERGITVLGATGYCLGGRYVFDLAFDHIIKASVIAHPSRLEVPADFEKYASVCKAPLLIHSCEMDMRFPIDAQAKADEILGNGRYKPGYHRTYSEGCRHGFAVRGSLKDPKVRAGKARALQASVEWFRKYLSQIQVSKL